MHHIPGRNHLAPDSLSCHPTGTTNPEKVHLPDDVSTIQNDKTNDTTAAVTLKPSIPTIGKNLSGIHCVNRITDEFDMGIKIAAVSTMNSLQSVTWDTVRVATYSDDNMRKLVDRYA